MLTRYSWDQLAVAARCVVRSRLGMINQILGPVIGKDGDRWTGHRVDGQAAKLPRQDRSADRRSFRMSELKTPEAKEAGLLAAFAAMGHPIGNVSA